jgi:death-on-curing protein
MPSFIYFGVDWAIKEHDQIILFTGGLSGVPKRAELESMLEFIKDDSYYESFTDKMTHLVFSIAKGHYFADGNKRSSIAIGSYFMIVNGLGSLVGVFIPSMENVVLCVADNIISKDQLHEIIVEILSEGEMSEESQLLVLNSMEEYQRREDDRV